MSIKMADDDHSETEDEIDAKLPIFDAKDHASRFDPEAYFKAFYKTPHEEGAMTMILFFLPSFAYRLLQEKTLQESGTLLDVGSGPTIHIPTAFRKSVAKLYLSDYCADNRLALHRWWKADESAFDWHTIITWLQTLEASHDRIKDMIALTRSKIEGILQCDVFDKKVLTSATPIPKQFDVVTSVFCLEYASQSLEEYNRAVDNVLRLIKPGGFVMLGGVCHESYYKFNGIRFRCHKLEPEHVTDALTRHDFCTDESSKEWHHKFVEREGIFVLLSQKMIKSDKTSS